MSRKTRVAGSIAVAAIFATAVFGAETTGAAAQDIVPELIQDLSAAPEPVSSEITGTEASIAFKSEEVVQPLPENEDGQSSALAASVASLADLVAITPIDGPLGKQMQCLAGAIYFESKGEPLEGQLAVGRVIVNRAASPRFPSSYCGVVFQRSQFSFVRGGRMPTINTTSRAWRRAKAIAKIAADGSWDSPAKGALFFHARYVSPGWRLERIAQVSNHIFYR